MVLKSDAKFEQKLTCENWDFNWILLYKVENIQRSYTTDKCGDPGQSNPVKSEPLTL